MTGENDPDIRRERGDASRGGPGRGSRTHDSNQDSGRSDQGGHVGGNAQDKNLDPDMGMPTGGADRNEGDQGSGAGDARVGPNARPEVEADDVEDLGERVGEQEIEGAEETEDEAQEGAEGDSDVLLEDPDGHDRLPPSGGSGRDSGGGTNRTGSSRGSFRGGINRKTT